MDDNFTLMYYNVTNFTSYVFQVCYMQNTTKGESSWAVENSLHDHLPFLGMQIGLTIFISQILTFVLRPLFQTHVLAKILAGIIVGPSGLGSLTYYIMPFETNLIVETFAGLGLTYYMFLVGLEMDVSILRHIDKKSLSISVAGILIPIGVGIGLYFIPMAKNRQDLNPLGAAFWAITLTSTSFPDLARILSDVKLLHSDLGKTALNIAVISDISTYTLLVFAVTVSSDHEDYMMVPLAFGVLVILWFSLRPCVAKMIRKTKEKRRDFGEQHICLILSGVAICGFITEACGSHSMIGGFMFGLIIPNGELGITIMDRIEEFVSGILLPMFLVVSGIRTNLYIFIFKSNLGLVALVMILATVSKIASTFFVSLHFGMSARNGLALGSLTNTKGVLALIVINEGRNLQAMDNVTTTILIFTVLFMTILVGPILSLAHKSTRKSRQYKQRTLQRSNPDIELKILACVHSVGNISSTIKLLEVSNATKKSPIHLFVAHLVKLVGRNATMLIVHDNQQRVHHYDHDEKNLTREMVESEQIVKAFENHALSTGVVYVQPFTIVSPYTTMHEDVCNLAEEKHTTMILIPFQKQPIGGAGLQEGQDLIRKVNLNLLDMAPCSVGLLVDRGLGSSTHASNLHFAMIFIGGSDDREALSYAWRMAGSLAINLTVIRFISSKDDDKDFQDEDTAAEKELDDEHIDEFRFKSMCETSVTYLEKQVNNGVELVEYIETNCKDFDLYMVGHNHEEKSSIMMGLAECNDFPELGPFGEALVLSDFTTHTSVLVVQQFSRSRKLGLKSLNHTSKFQRKSWASPILNPNYEAYINQS